jgi:hypothetical protein
MQSFLEEYGVKRAIPIPKLLYAFNVVLVGNSCVFADELPR